MTHASSRLSTLQENAKCAFDLKEEDCPIGIKRFASTEYSDWEDRQKVDFLKEVIGEYDKRLHIVSIFDYELVEQAVKKVISREFEIAEEDLEWLK